MAAFDLPWTKTCGSSKPYLTSCCHDAFIIITITITTTTKIIIIIIIITIIIITKIIIISL